MAGYRNGLKYSDITPKTDWLNRRQLIAGAAALTLGADPVAFLLPVAMAASLGFMLPVATPPNAIVFTHRAVGRADMIRAGVLLDVIGIAVTVAIGAVLGPYLA